MRAKRTQTWNSDACRRAVVLVALVCITQNIATPSIGVVWGAKMRPALVHTPKILRVCCRFTQRTVCDDTYPLHMCWAYPLTIKTTQRLELKRHTYAKGDPSVRHHRRSATQTSIIHTIHSGCSSLVGCKLAIRIDSLYIS